jgi:hypothetical protein
MQQVDEDLQRLPHDGVGRPALAVDDEAHAARVVLVRGIVESVWLGLSGIPQWPLSRLHRFAPPVGQRLPDTTHPASISHRRKVE